MGKRKFDVYEKVTTAIVEALDRGVVPWRKPWRGDWRPRNLASGRAYRGVNVLLLGLAPFESPWWLTYRQAEAMGGQVKKGEHSQFVVFFTTWTPKPTDADPEPEERWILRYYNVFNLEQCEGIASPESEEELPVLHNIEDADAIVEGFAGRPAISHTGTRACYAPLSDVVSMPPFEDFTSEAGYYSTLFHELVHSTGHKSRLARFDEEGSSMVFGSKGYAREELTAEVGAAFLLNECGLLDDAPLENAAAYIASWKERLTDDPRAIVVASGRAQKAVDHILGNKAAETADQTQEMEVAS